MVKRHSRRFTFPSSVQEYHDEAITFDATGTALYVEEYVTPTKPNGSIFKLTPPPAGGNTWVRTDILDLDKNNRNAVGGLTLDTVAGSFFGVSQSGGPNVTDDGNGNGTVFHLQVSGTPKITTIATFSGYNTGSYPVALPILDPSGNLIGTTYGGSYTYNGNAVTGNYRTGSMSGYGLIYNLASPISGSAWTDTILARVADAPLKNLSGPLYRAPSGDLYGVTTHGGPYDAGTVFKMHKTGSTWLTYPIYVFLPNGPGNVPKGKDGINPRGPLVADQAGNLYGTTSGGGDNVGTAANDVGGTVFMLSPTKTGGWTETILYSFGNKQDWFSNPPNPRLVVLNGVVYGTTQRSGVDFGNLFALVPPALNPQPTTSWTYKSLYSFDSGDEGGLPTVGLIADKAGNLYGATSTGGPVPPGTGPIDYPGAGTIFKVVPHFCSLYVPC